MNYAIRLVFILIPLVVASCASTEITGKWSDKEYDKPIKTVLVVGLSKDTMRRRIFEDTLVEQFKTKGVTAFSSAAIFPIDKELDEATLEPVLAERSIDAVIITRLVKVEKDTKYVPGQYASSPGVYRPPHSYNHGFYDYYYQAQPVVYSPGYMVDETIASLETNMYVTPDEKLIWSLTSETFNPNNVNKVINELAAIIIKELTKDGVI